MTQDRSCIRVLWVDDEIYNNPIEKESSAIQELIDHGPFQIITAQTATEALEHLRRNLIDIVIVDIMLPPGRELADLGMQNGREAGFHLIKLIRDKLESDVPILVVTNYPKVVPKKTRDELHVAEYIAKPVKMESLAATIKDVLKRS